MAFVVPAIAVATTVIGAVQQKRAGDAAKKAGKQEQQASVSAYHMYNWNAKVADLQAADALNRGAIEEAHFREQVEQHIGAQRAGIAAGNIDVNFGSAVDVQADSAYLGEIDAITIRNNAMREAWGYKVQAVDQRKRGVIAAREGINAAAAGQQMANQMYFSAGATLLGAGSSLLASRYGFKPNAKAPKIYGNGLGASGF